MGLRKLEADFAPRCAMAKFRALSFALRCGQNGLECSTRSDNLQPRRSSRWRSGMSVSSIVKGIPLESEGSSRSQLKKSFRSLFRPCYHS